MSNREDPQPNATNQDAWFTTTHWTVVLNAKDPKSPVAADALEQLCRTYWYPLYFYARRSGLNKESAEDSTQGFFARILEKNFLSQVQREKGKFRSFLLASLKHFLADEREKAKAVKRGGDREILSLDALAAEERYAREPVDTRDPGKLFERQWALTLLDRARERLKAEYVAKGKAELFEHLQLFESGAKESPAYGEVAPRVGLSEGGLRSAVFAFRKQYGELVRNAVAHTVADPAQVDEEIQYLIRVVKG